MKHVGTIPFETERLCCRPFEWGDAGAMHRNWAADDAVQREYGEPVYATPEEVQDLLQRYMDCYERQDYYRWAIVEKQRGENIGQIAFCRTYDDCGTAEIEYCIGRRFWGRGYAGEALAGLIGHAFTHTGFVRLEAYHRVANRQSGRVLEKAALHRTETVERFARAGITPENEVCYCIRREEWLEKGGEQNEASDQAE